MNERLDPAGKSAARQAARRKAYLFGLKAESIAVLWLRLKGYRILARRYLGAGGEIDIVAARGEAIVFVEVKARPSLDEARLSLTPEKTRRMSRAARHWLARNRHRPGAVLRGDAVFLAPRRLPRHAANAIELDIS